MKKVLCLTTVFFVCFLSVTIFCVMQRKSNVELTQECKQYLKDQGVENYKIKKTGNIVEKVSMQREDIEVSDEEVEEKINDELSVAGEFIEITDRSNVKKGDFVEISYSVYLKDKLINSCDKEIIKVGAGYYGKEFEEKLIGIKKGIETEFELVVPDDEKQYAGETENIKVLVSKIEQKEVPVLDDKYVADNYKDIKNVDEYYELIKSQIKKEKELKAQNNKLDEVKKSLNKAYFVEISETEKAAYAEKVYKEYLQMAKSMGVSFEEFANEMFGESKEQFLNNCYDKSIDELETILLYCAYITDSNISASKNEINNYISHNDIKNEMYESKEKMNNYVKYKVLEEKALNKLVK